jgi:hypothetical protein
MVLQLKADPSLLTEPNSIGWTTLHFCAASPEIPLETWEWVVQRVPPGLDLLMLRTDNGQNCIDHLFRLYLNPLEWQRHEVKEAAKELRASILQCLENDSDLELLKVTLLKQASGEETLVNKHVLKIVPFWTRLTVLLQQLSPSIVHALAQTACPREVASVGHAIVSISCR